MSVEGLKSVFDIFTVVVLFLAFLFGAGVLVTGNIINKRQAEQLRQFDKDLRDKDLKIAEVQRGVKEADARIAEAQRGSAEANERATKAQQSLASAEQHAKEADAKAEGFRLDIAKSTERAAKLESEAAAAKLETEKLKQVVAWRIIPPGSAAELERVLSRKPGSVNLRYTDGDPEALFLAIQVSQILGKAKWQVAPGSEKFANAVQFGIALPDSTGDAAAALREAFVAAKISFSVNPLPARGAAFSVSTIPGAPTLMIGSRYPIQIP